jgi:hypothetical protein
VLHNFEGKESNFFDASPEGLASFEKQQPDTGANIIFLRGYPTPQWLKTIGAQYNVDPDIFQRHMQFQPSAPGGRDLYLLPSLPSSSLNVFQLWTSTICSRDSVGGVFGPEDLQQLRHDSLESVTRYHQTLQTSAKNGDSLVRKCWILSSQLYVIEQTISMEVGNLRDGWRGTLILTELEFLCWY